MVTVELALSLLTVAIILTGLVGAIGIGLAVGMCQSVSTELARQLARGDAATAEEIRESLPPRVEVTVTAVGDGVEVELRGAGGAAGHTATPGG